MAGTLLLGKDFCRLASRRRFSGVNTDGSANRLLERIGGRDFIVYSFSIRILPLNI